MHNVMMSYHINVITNKIIEISSAMRTKHTWLVMAPDIISFLLAFPFPSLLLSSAASASLSPFVSTFPRLSATVQRLPLPAD